MFPERLRRTTLFVGAVAAFGVAEQHHHPAEPIAGIRGAQWPSSSWSLWVIWFCMAGMLCIVAGFTWTKRPAIMRVAAVVFASAIWARAAALFIEYGWDLWGTVMLHAMASLLLVSSWSWSGSALRAIDR